MVGPLVNDEDIRALLELIDAANASRALRRTSRDEGHGERDAEARLDSLFGTGERLAVYGSLAPGRQNHHIVESLGGTWTEGSIEGDLLTYGWGDAIGYPALHVRPGGPAVPVHVLTSPALRAAWPELDTFEGLEYRRVLVPVWSTAVRSERVLVTVANLYEAAMPTDLHLRQAAEW
jgi:gamma-glutamylcyclotransferase (GGCT)/AIG2-like uncharacterized protein YtfP